MSTTQTTDQQNALKDAMARAKQIAAKLQQQQHGGPGENNATTEPEETRKRPFLENAPTEPAPKRNAMDGAVDHTDPKVIAQQVANSLVQRAGLGSMLVEEINIPNRLVGLVIGRGGEMINKLQSESGAKIQVAPDPPPNMANMVEERQITITGTSEAVNKAKDLITEIRSDGKIPERLMGGPLPGEFSIEMNIAQGKVGLVIGKGGETIKSLQERAGCKMVLFQDGEYANAPEKPLRISGEQSTVMYGKQLVQDLLTMKELEALNPDKRQEGLSYKEIDVPREAVGFVIGAKGASINQLQMQTGCRVQFKNDMQGESKTAMLTGTPQQLAAAEAKLNEILQSTTWGGRGQRPSWNPQNQGGAFNGMVRPGFAPGQQGPGGPRGWGPGGPRPFVGGGHGTDGNTALPPGHKHMIIHVPANKCGLVIGKGGDTLKYIHNESKVNIEINRDVPDNSPIRMFHIRGNDEMIEKALNIIREKINDPSIQAKPADGGDAIHNNQNQWNAAQPGGWAPPQQNPQWNQQNQWQGQQPGWGQQPPAQPDQWGQQQGAWNQPQPQPAAPAWNQPQPTPQPQPTWDPQQQQWQQPNAAPQGQWPNQQQAYPWAQPGQTFQAPAPTPGPQNPPASVPQPAPAPAPAAPVDPNQQPAPQAQGQPDYSAAWALYYQQQSQYYQQYAMQQPAAPGASVAAPTPSTGAPVQSQTPVTPASAANMAGQPQAMADYQAKLAEYYKSYGQPPPQ